MISYKANGTVEVTVDGVTTIVPAGTQAQKDAAIAALLPPPPVPTSVTNYQFRAAVRASGKAAAFKAHHSGLSEAAQEEWSMARIRRNSDMVEVARVAFNVTNGAIDTLFRNATGYPE